MAKQRRAVRTRKATARKPAPKRDVVGNKSQAIRDYLAAHKGAKPLEVVEALGEKVICFNQSETLCRFG